MNILLVSECSKRALPETRRILDQFAERKGSRTWQTPITHEGLKTLRQLLKKSARRNTAVACHWIRGKNHTDLLWIVGQRKKFNLDGTVPTNTTQRNVLRSEDESQMNSIQASALMAGIAGLFHDFGKANTLFQAKLKKTSGYEPYRHEWLSSLMFIKFVAGRTDKQWLEHLRNITSVDDKSLVNHCDPTQVINLTALSNSPLAQCIAWLILSHHRLPANLIRPQQLGDSEQWLEGIGAEWNSKNHTKKDGGITQTQLQDNVTFPFGTPIRSHRWRSKAAELAKRALNQTNLAEYATLDNAFPMHTARMALMLADHAYSSGLPNAYWQDDDYAAIANTDRTTGKEKQKLDEHCCGVAHNAYLLARTLPKLRASMPAITRHKGFKRRSSIAKFRWQDKAYDCAYSVAKKAEQNGFFGVNMASTGKGKTFANARIMYGLANPELGCRFSVALGLRTLTLQTGDALQQRLNLDSDDLAVHIGSQVFKDLFDDKKEAGKEPENPTGSESEDLFPEHEYVRYDGEVDNHHLSKWLKERGNTHNLVSAPISVSTIDHIMPVSEGTRGGQQIAPMLRLLTSDLVLDEPDDFSLDDNPALARLVYFAGLLGSRVLLSSATLPPDFVKTLFSCYQRGREQYNRVIGQQTKHPVTCAWFDEFHTQSHDLNSPSEFLDAHQSFTHARHRKINKNTLNLHLGNWLNIDTALAHSEGTIAHFSDIVLKGIQTLSSRHRTVSLQPETKGKTLSTGVVRMANIEPLVAVANQLFTMPAPPDTRIHYCVYHSQHPLAVRSALEQELDKLLQRDAKDDQTPFSHETVRNALHAYPETHHVFVVLATPVAEVGRDHDYDWAVVEPSSMRSIIQLAGRVQRHRQNPPDETNILVLNQNTKALAGNGKPAYINPGYESGQAFKVYKNASNKNCLRLSSTDLRSQLAQEHLHTICSSPRFLAPDNKTLLTDEQASGFIELEHLAIKLKLHETVAPWCKSPYAHLFAEFQKQTPFRRSTPNIEYVCLISENHSEPTFHQWDNASKTLIQTEVITPFKALSMNPSVSVWGTFDLATEIESLASKHDMSLTQASIKFGTLSLRAPNKEEMGSVWFYHPILGVFRGTEISAFRLGNNCKEEK
ncbi:type I-F CRISPR-associated helicase Cas3 [Vibrio sp. SCSIO 43132]|uniref:type I-F CRISPR-associated helicase Cas3f n=1 Tax=Vibrio sp. SCSIO 43132 TaxID=2779363 RepID=UPI001CA9D130|nr:type I-F CRISPR-associated helicase Cas3f [Vibrio sp. SCSIO 43132]UAB71345.1 type I-F CRISPR-associated helicase Cas3 [Vibrio sp. SCSIO 43132]